jgi:hypothetical protein
MLSKYELFCITENKSVQTDYRDSVPTVCPNNNTHTIDAGSIAVIAQTAEVDTNIKSAAIALPSYEKGFQDLTGHNFYKKGLRGTAVAGQTTDFYISFSTNMYLSGGGYHAGSTANGGDYVGAQIVDKDNILGYGPGTVLGTFLETDYVWPGREWEVRTNDAKIIPTGIYLRMRYVSTGAQDVELIGWYSMRT